MRLHNCVKLLGGCRLRLFNIRVLGLCLNRLGRCYGSFNLSKVVDQIPVIEVLLEFFKSTFDRRRNSVSNLIIKNDTFLEGSQSGLFTAEGLIVMNCLQLLDGALVVLDQLLGRARLDLREGLL